VKPIKTAKKRFKTCRVSGGQLVFLDVNTRLHLAHGRKAAHDVPGNELRGQKPQAKQARSVFRRVVDGTVRNQSRMKKQRRWKGHKKWVNGPTGFVGVTENHWGVSWAGNEPEPKLN